MSKFFQGIFLVLIIAGIYLYRDWQAPVIVDQLQLRPVPEDSIKMASPTTSDNQRIPARFEKVDIDSGTYSLWLKKFLQKNHRKFHYDSCNRADMGRCYHLTQEFNYLVQVLSRGHPEELAREGLRLEHQDFLQSLAIEINIKSCVPQKSGKQYCFNIMDSIQYFNKKGQLELIGYLNEKCIAGNSLYCRNLVQVYYRLNLYQEGQKIAKLNCELNGDCLEWAAVLRKTDKIKSEELYCRACEKEIEGCASVIEAFPVMSCHERALSKLSQYCEIPARIKESQGKSYCLDFAIYLLYEGELVNLELPEKLCLSGYIFACEFHIAFLEAIGKKQKAKFYFQEYCEQSLLGHSNCERGSFQGVFVRSIEGRQSFVNYKFNYNEN